MKKIAVCAEGRDLASAVSSHLGRSPYFILYDLETDRWEVAENPATTEPRGAGIKSATLLAEKGVEVVIAGHCGPKAFAVLKAGGIKVARVKGKTVREALELAKRGDLEFLSAPTVDTHFGGGFPGWGKLAGKDFSTE